MTQTRRLSYTPAGFRRRMMISKESALFIVVEGRVTDRWFYDNLARRSPKLVAHGYQIWRIESFKLGNVSTGGKSAILKLRSELLSLRSLRVGTQHGLRSVMFCLDADHDRLVRSAIKCPHVTYTQLPDAEGHVLDSVDINEVLAAVMSLPSAEMGRLLRHLGDYRSKLATRWASWIGVCCVSARSGASGPRAGTPGPEPGFKTTPQAKLNAVNKRIAATAQIDPVALKRLQMDVDQQIRGLIARGEARKLLKGKWIADYLTHEVNAYAAKNNLRKVSSDELTSAARANACFNGQWLSYFRRRANALL